MGDREQKNSLRTTSKYLNAKAQPGGRQRGKRSSTQHGKKKEEKKTTKSPALRRMTSALSENN